MRLLLEKIKLPEHDLRADVDDDHVDEIADSMRDRGQLQASAVKVIGDDLYAVVFGATRFRAAQRLKWTEINADIRPAASDTEHAADKLIENVQRKNLTPIEEAFGLLALCDGTVPNIRELQRHTGKSRAWVQSRLALAALPDDLQKSVQADLLTAGVAIEFGRIENPLVREQYIGWASENGCTAAQAIAWVANAPAVQTGIMTMADINNAGYDPAPEIEYVKPRWNCTGCLQPYEFNQINQLIICGQCQARLVASRPAPTIPGTPVSIDINI